MTTAVCYKCGSLKFGSFCPCEECGARPTARDDLIISLAMSDHYFDCNTLEQMAESIKQTGQPPTLDPESKKQFAQLLDECGDALSALDREFDASGHSDRSQVTEPDKSPWWQFWKS